MAEEQAFERSSYRHLAAEILQHVIGDYGMKWRWSGFKDELLPRNLPYLSRVITFEMARIGNTSDNIRDVVFDSDRSMVKVWLLWSLIDATFTYRRGFPAVIVVCAIIGKLSLFCYSIGKYWLVDDLVEILARVLSERVGDSLPALDLYALAKLGRIIPEAA